MDADFVKLVSVSSLITLLLFGKYIGSEKPQVPCYFIFGDSLVDNGNNNHLESNWKANYPPYGVDFPKGYTGRFTNGKTSADIIGQSLGFDEFIPSYATATDDQFSKGVNYASGGAGIRDESGSHNGDIICLDRQLRNHKSTVSSLRRSTKNTTFLKECIYLINIGNNDYINNYLMPGKHYNSGLIYSKDEYAEVLMKQYHHQLRALYNLGGRKIATFGLTHIGCTPFMVKKFSTEGKPCVNWINDVIDAFNNRLKSLIIKLNKDKPDARFTFINTAGILFPQGAVSLRTPVCCQLTGDWACTLNSNPCPVRSLTTYFDALHPTEVSNMMIATRSYKAALPTDAYPYDIHHLTQV
ncbi:putative triacylglycerol lipase [Helianthus debilis subsp. tardiflorus]